MPQTLVQKIKFTNTTTRVLYDLYMNAKKHALVTGGPAIISATPGSPYSVHGGYITGKNLELVKDKMIVQTWRALGWDKKDTDSIFILNLEQKDKHVILHMVHANLPDKHAGHVDQGWHDHYWKPWKQHLAGKPITRPKM